MNKARFIRPIAKAAGILALLYACYYLMARCVAYLISVQTWEPPYRSMSDTGPIPLPPSIAKVSMSSSAWVWGIPLTLAALASGLIVLCAVALCFKRSRNQVFLFLKAAFQGAIEIVIKQILETRRNDDHAILRYDYMQNTHRIDFCNEDDSSCKCLSQGVPAI